MHFMTPLGTWFPSGMCPTHSPQPASIPPLLVSEGRLVEPIPHGAPVGHVLVHQGDEAVVVVALEQVEHLVQDDVVEALGRFLDQLQIEPDAMGLGGAGAPLGLHPLDVPLCDVDA